MRSVVILGSTGSIGTQALDVAARNPELFRIVGLGATEDIDLNGLEVKKVNEEVEGFRHALIVGGDGKASRQGLSLPA